MRAMENIDARLSALIMNLLQSGSMPGKGHAVFNKLREAEQALIMFTYIVHTTDGYGYALREE